MAPPQSPAGTGPRQVHSHRLCALACLPTSRISTHGNMTSQHPPFNPEVSTLHSTFCEFLFPKSLLSLLIATVPFCFSASHTIYYQSQLTGVPTSVFFFILSPVVQIMVSSDPGNGKPWGQLWKVSIHFHWKGNIHLCDFIFKFLLLILIELLSLA